MHKHLAKTALAVLFGLLSVSALGQAPGQPSADEIVKKLSIPDQKPMVRTRGIVIESPLATAQPDAEPKSIDLQINFEYNSAKLSPDSRFVLDNLAIALGSSELASARFSIVGHTDGKGADTYNRKLSRQRAQAVADYLVAQKAVKADRLSVLGLGSSQLLDPDHPESPSNRRVQVINLGR